MLKLHHFAKHRTREKRALDCLYLGQSVAGHAEAGNCQAIGSRGTFQNRRSMVRLKNTITPNGLGVAGIWMSGHWVTSVTVALDTLRTRHREQITLEGRQKLRQAFQNKRNPEEIRTNHLSTRADALQLCAMLSAQPLRHTSLKTRVPFCAVYSCYPLCPSSLSCLTWRP